MDTAAPPDLFDAESRALQAARAAYDASATTQSEPCRQALGELLTAYERLLRETRRLVRRSDRAEFDMNQLNLRLQDLAAELEYRATHDPLTGVLNRAAIIELVNSHFSDGDIALIVLDIDHFKRINDTHGHVAGDRVLQSVARTLAACVRPMDTLARYGGEEFAIVLPACQAEFGRAVAERIRRAVAAMPIPVSPHTAVHVTLSIGGAFALQWIRSTTALWTSRADAQLYRAKSEGRNRVCIEEQPNSTVSAEEKTLLFGQLYTSEWGGLPPMNSHDSAH